MGYPSRYEISAHKKGAIPNKTFAELMDRYLDQVSSLKKGFRWEEIRVNAIRKTALGQVRLPELNASHFAQWRDERLKSVSDSTVLREWKLLTHACNTAVKEWQWLHENPMKDVKRPKDAPHRDRRISQEEIDRILLATGYEYDRVPETLISRVGAAFLFAIETARPVKSLHSQGKTSTSKNVWPDSWIRRTARHETCRSRKKPSESLIKCPAKKEKYLT